MPLCCVQARCNVSRSAVRWIPGGEMTGRTASQITVEDDGKTSKNTIMRMKIMLTMRIKRGGCR